VALSTPGIKKRQQVPNIHVKDAARQYDEASDLLYRALNPGSGLLLPFLNTTVMAIELYLKTLSATAIYKPTVWDPEMSTVHAPSHHTLDFQNVPWPFAPTAARAIAERTARWCIRRACHRSGDTRHRD